MSVEDAGHQGRRLASRLTGAVLSLPIAIVLTSLGAGVVLGRRLLALVSSVLPGLPAEPLPPQHDSGRVRERAVAAMKVARASGLLSRKS